MKQKEALENLIETLHKKNILFNEEKIELCLKAKYKNKPLYLFKFVEEDG